MTRYALDTNTVSQLLKQHPQVTRRVVSVPMAALCISAITEGELIFGLARRPDAKRLHNIVQEFLRRVDVLPWDRAIAARYGVMRAELQNRGKALGTLDMLIAAHAIGIDAVLVTNDKAFRQVNGLVVEDWSAA